MKNRIDIFGHQIELTDEQVKKLREILWISNIRLSAEYTNADRIRAMSDKELCQFLISVHQGMLVKKDILNVLYWLQQPAEEDDHGQAEI